MSALGLLARLRSPSLDRALSSGADPTRSRQLRVRALQLTSCAHRAELARDLERLVCEARRAPSRRRVALNRTPILLNTDTLRQIAAELHGPGPLYAQGIAHLRALITDGNGPVFARAREERDLAQVLAEAHALLHGKVPVPRAARSSRTA
jgi:hypothetical protein